VLVIGGCAGTLASRLTLPDENQLVKDQLVIHSDFTLAEHHRLFEELTVQRAELCQKLGLSPSDEPIDVYLFDSSDRFDGFMRLNHPRFPRRRAFFVETDAHLSVYAHWGDRMAEDLRHEVCHAYLHAVVPRVPLWLDEGIAEYFEVARGQRGVNRRHLDRLLVRIRQEHWQPDLKRLEQFTSDQSMEQDDYAEAWAWVHFLLESRPEQRDWLRDYLVDLRRFGDPTPLSVRLTAMLPDANAAMVEHVRRLEKGNW
jgi:hypothetical protein